MIAETNVTECDGARMCKSLDKRYMWFIGKNQ